MMKSRIVVAASIAALSLGVASAQAPNFSGVWQANLEKSKFAGPPPKSYMVLIDQQGSKVTETIGSAGQRGEQRSTFTYDTSGAHPSLNSLMGTPMQSTVTIEGNTLKLDSKLAIPDHPGTGMESWTLSADGNTLTIASSYKMGEHGMEQTLVLDKQPESAGEALRKPEQTAGERYKNIQVLKDMPASQLLETMRVFTWSLGVRCDHCHVPGNFASDDKEDKKMARKMLTMTMAANASAFGGQPEVRCYTCHRGQHEPQNYPAFQ
jgi:hypothetical protein